MDRRSTVRVPKREASDRPCTRTLGALHQEPTGATGRSAQRGAQPWYPPTALQRNTLHSQPRCRNQGLGSGPEPKPGLTVFAGRRAEPRRHAAAMRRGCGRRLRPGRWPLCQRPCWGVDVRPRRVQRQRALRHCAKRPLRARRHQLAEAAYSATRMRASSNRVLGPLAGVPVRSEHALQDMRLPRRDTRPPHPAHGAYGRRRVESNQTETSNQTMPDIMR